MSQSKTRIVGGSENGMVGKVLQEEGALSYSPFSKGRRRRLLEVGIGRKGQKDGTKRVRGVWEAPRARSKR